MCRGELQGAVLGKRLAVSILSGSRFEFDRTIFLLDSEILRAKISNDSHTYDAFVGIRIGGILSKFSPDQFYHNIGVENSSADLLSRGTTASTKLDSDSAWHNGPPLLYEDFDNWQVSQQHGSLNTMTL